MKKLIALACLGLFVATVVMPFGSAFAECNGKSHKTATGEPAPKTTKA